jgi:MFS transporter, YQGE family, putative transporter
MSSRLKAVVGDVELHKDLILLLIIGGLYSVSIFLSNSFVNIFLWKQAGEFSTIAFYNLAIYISQPLTFILAGRWAKKMDRVIVLRLGVIFLSLFFMTVLLVGEQAAKFNVMLGLILGIGYGFYWLAYNVLTFEITEPETRQFFNGFFGLLQSFGGMISPISAGFIISRMEANSGYTTIFTISLILFILAVVSSFFLERRSAEGKYAFVHIFQERTKNNNWSRILHANFFQGIREGIFAFVISTWIFIITNSELSLGTFNLVYSACSFIFYYVVTRFLQTKHRKKSIFIGGLILFLSIFILLFFQNFTAVLIYGVIIGTAYPIIYVPYLSLSYDIIGSAWNAKEMRIEYIVVKEIFLNSGRVFSILIFIITISFIETDTAIPFLLAILGIGHFIIYFCVKNIQLVPRSKKERKKSQPIITKEVSDEENR